MVNRSLSSYRNPLMQSQAQTGSYGGYAPMASRAISGAMPGDPTVAAPSDTSAASTPSTGQTADSGIPNLTSTSYNPGRDWGYSGSGVPNYSGDDPAQMFVNNGQQALGRYNQAQQNLGAWQNSNMANQGYYQQNANNIYNDPNYGQYNSTEMGNMLQGQNWNNALTTDGEYQSNYLTPQEQQGMMGDFSGYQNAYNSGVGDVQGRFNNSSQALLGGVNNTSQSLQGQQNAYQNQSNDIYNNGNNAQSDAYGDYYNSLNGIDTSKMAVGNDFYQGVADINKNLQNSVHGDVNDQALSADPAALAKMQMSDEDVNGMVDKAGRGAAAQIQSATDADQRQSDAAGNGALGMAALRNRGLQQSAIASSDAETDARVSADAAQRQQVQSAEQMRLGAQQNLASQKSSNDLALGNTNLSSGMQEEQMGLNQQNNIAGFQQANANSLGNYRQNMLANQQQTGLALANQQNQSAQNAAMYSGNQNYNAQSNLGQQNVAIGQNNMQANMGMNQFLGQNQQQAAGQIATNRQGVNQANQNQRYGQYSNYAGYNGNVYGNAANQRLSGQQQQGQYNNGNSQYWGTQASNTFGQQLQNNNQTNSAQSSAAQGLAGYRNGQTSFGKSFASGLGSALGKTVGSGFGTFGG